ncbi:endonuclease domain-containing 1 protein-like [Chamaea fasciata]|uniref:endonuclease domain-containing 1 protein-like n=1 Tax=Chamaea fasciata TaxID=190680 RepID=UPI00336AA13E
MQGLLLLLQVLASCLWLGHSEVVTPFASCPQFFYVGAIPNDVLQPLNPAYICQRYSNSYHFATLYDKEKRIPVYSAYKYKPGSLKRPHTWSFVEPQLIGNNSFKEMERAWVLIDQYNFTLDQIKVSEAVLEDYENMTGLDRGQLSPSGHQDTTDSKTATFTLTNVVPQDSSMYTGWWNTYETQIMHKYSTNCTITCVITGAVPGNTYIVEGRVNRPSHIWSAACCLVGTQPGRAWGSIADNDVNRGEILSLGDLEDRLTTLYNRHKNFTQFKNASLFNNACPRK